MSHTDISFDELSTLIKKENGIHLTDFISTRFVYNEFSATQGSIEAEEVEVVMDGSKFDLSFTAQPYKGRLSLNVEYKTDKYTKAAIISYIRQWEIMLSMMCDHGEGTIEKLLSRSLDDTADKLKAKSHELLKSMKK